MRKMARILLEVKNFPAQQAIFDHPAKFKIAVKGRRFGLTKGAANDFIQCALKKSFKKGLWVDTVNSNIERYVERYFIPKINKLPQSMWNWRKQQKILELNGSYIDFRSIDNPLNLEGFGYDKAFLNEAGIILKDEYLWNNAIKPMFWDFPNVKVVVGGTPKGKGVFNELYERGLDPNQPNYKSFHYTSFDSPFEHIHKAIREDMASMPEMVIKQEIMAEFLDDNGTVFRGIELVATATPQKPIDGHLYVIGIDLAKVQDWTVLSVYDRATNAQVYQDRFNKLEWPFQKAKIIEMAKHYNNALCIIDATGLGDPICDDLLRAGVSVEPIKLTNEGKKEIIEKLSIWIEQRIIKILNIPDTIREFKNFTYDISSTGRIRYEAPAGFSDDIVISHALALSSLVPINKIVTVKPKTIIEIGYEEAKRKHYGEDTDSLDEWSRF
jgi:hypothetical protein